LQWGLPPKANLRLTSASREFDEAKAAELAKEAGEGIVVGAIMSSAQSAKRIQKAAGFDVAVIDVKFGLPPKIKMTFKKKGQDDGGRMDDLDLMCGMAMDN